jgi:hypothetical protein
LGLNLVGLFLKLDLAFQGSFCRCLEELGFEQGETDKTECEKAGNKEESLSPAKKPVGGCRDHLWFSS